MGQDWIICLYVGDHASFGAHVLFLCNRNLFFSLPVVDFLNLPIIIALHLIVSEVFLSIVTDCTVLVFLLTLTRKFTPHEAVRMNEIKPKRLYAQHKEEQLRDKQMRSKPIYKTHNYCFPVENKTASNFHLAFTFTHTQLEHFLWMRQRGLW